jgi:hypothetical protein
MHALLAAFSLSAAIETSAIRLAFLVLPSDVDEERRPQRLAAIGRTWGAHTGSDTHVLCSQEEADLYATNCSDCAALRMLVVPRPLIKIRSAVQKTALFQDLFLGGPWTGATTQHLQFALASLAAQQPPYDFLAVGLDQTLWIPENLLCLLRGRDSALPLYMGSGLTADYKGGLRYVGLSSGAVFSLGALRLLAAAWAPERAAADCGRPNLWGHCPNAERSHCFPVNEYEVRVREGEGEGERERGGTRCGCERAGAALVCRVSGGGCCWRASNAAPLPPRCTTPRWCWASAWRTCACR